MNNYKWIFPYVLLLGAILATPALGDENAMRPADKARKEADRLATILQPETESLAIDRARGRTNLSVCVGVFTVDQIFSGDPHLAVGNKFWVFGPIAFLNAYVISPRTSATGNPWVAGNYAALHHPLMLTWHVLENIPVKSHGPDAETAHSYNFGVTSWDENDCPEYIEFWHGDHPNAIIQLLHPGHAGATRD